MFMIIEVIQITKYIPDTNNLNSPGLFHSWLYSPEYDRFRPLELFRSSYLDRSSERIRNDHENAENLYL